MANTISIFETGESIEPAALPRFVFKINGDNNNIRIGKSFLTNQQHHVSISIGGSNNNFCMQSTNGQIYMTVIMMNDSTIDIGPSFFSWQTAIHCFHKSVYIGKENLFAYGVSILPSDGHFIHSLKDDRVLNPPKDIHIGDNNWVGRNVTFLKGSGIGNHNVVGMNSTVTKPFDVSNCVLAGYPAHIVRTGITWNDKMDPEAL